MVKRLRAAETLSAVPAIATDKTGTLTENPMAVSTLVPEALRVPLLEIGVLCNDAVAGAGGEGEAGGARGAGRARGAGAFLGDPLEVALLDAARAAGLDVEGLRALCPVQQEFSFDAVRKRMSVVCACDANDGARRVAAKGALESVLACSTQQRRGAQVILLTAADRAKLLDDATTLMQQGLRVIACAEKTVPSAPQPSTLPLRQEEVEADLTFVGLVGLADPPRPEVAPAIAACRGAGIRLVMVTGDHSDTARAIAHAVGLDGSGRLLTGPELDARTDDERRDVVERVAIVARATPEHQLGLVGALPRRAIRASCSCTGAWWPASFSRRQGSSLRWPASISRVGTAAWVWRRRAPPPSSPGCSGMCSSRSICAPSASHWSGWACSPIG